MLNYCGVHCVDHPMRLTVLQANPLMLCTDYWNYFLTNDGIPLDRKWSVGRWLEVRYCRFSKIPCKYFKNSLNFQILGKSCKSYLKVSLSSSTFSESNLSQVFGFKNAVAYANGPALTVMMNYDLMRLFSSFWKWIEI